MTISMPPAPGSPHPALLQELRGPLDLILRRLDGLSRLEEILDPPPGSETGPDPQAVLAALERAAHQLEALSRQLPERLSGIEARLAELERLGAERHAAQMAVLQHLASVFEELA